MNKSNIGASVNVFRPFDLLLAFDKENLRLSGGGKGEKGKRKTAVVPKRRSSKKRR